MSDLRLDMSGFRAEYVRATWISHCRKVAASGWAAGAGAAGHVAAPELPRAGQRELEPQGTWRSWSCPGLGSGSWSRRTRGGPGAASGWTVGAGAAGHVAAPKPTSVGRRGPELQLAWQRVDTCPAACLDLDLVCGGTRSSGYRQWPSLFHTGDARPSTSHRRPPWGPHHRQDPTAHSVSTPPRGCALIKELSRSRHQLLSTGAAAGLTPATPPQAVWARALCIAQAWAGRAVFGCGLGCCAPAYMPLWNAARHEPQAHNCRSLGSDSSHNGIKPFSIFEFHLIYFKYSVNFQNSCKFIDDL
jgi:hypothetical protein